MNIAHERRGGEPLRVRVDDVDACARNLEVSQIWSKHELKLPDDDLEA